MSGVGRIPLRRSGPSTDIVADLTCSQCQREGKGTYSLRVECGNCGSSGVGIWSRTHEASVDPCPVCKAKTLRPKRPTELVEWCVLDEVVRPTKEEGE